MIKRRAVQELRQGLSEQAAVSLIGPRQVGKTTLAMELANELDAIYLDLEDRRDRVKLEEPALFLGSCKDRLVILDEVHRIPELFQDLRGIIDRGRREGLRTGRFLLLGSASLDLLRQAGETLAGRVAHVELGPLDLIEVSEHADALQHLWVRGGYPDSFLANDDEQSFRWRQDFIRTFLERDVALFGPRLPAETLGRFWTMLAHTHGQLLNASQLARSLGSSPQTVSRYVDLLVDLLLVRRLPPLFANVGKRLVKSPRVYVRDSGQVHALLGLANMQDVLGHPVAGASWEGFVIENLLAVAPPRTDAAFYRTAAGAEIDLILTFANGQRWAVEIKRSLSPRLERGFHHAREDLEPDQAWLVYPGHDRYPKAENVEAISLQELMTLLQTRKP
ncbi:MAG: ATP-binding protein [Wenzhouxiangella sp.]|nr:MAG: ATP-binding protein [Wenzhouxiangella sp.]